MEQSENDPAPAPQGWQGYQGWQPPHPSAPPNPYQPNPYQPNPYQYGYLPQPQAQPRRAVVIAGWRRYLGAGLIGGGVIVGIIGLFPKYGNNMIVAGDPPMLTSHACYLAAWIGAAVWILVGRKRAGDGGLFGVAWGLVALCELLIDLTGVTADSKPGVQAGLILALASWLLCATGAAFCCRLRPVSPRPLPGTGVSGAVIGLRVLLLAAVVLAVVFYLPGWFHYDVNGRSAGTNNAWDDESLGMLVTAVLYLLVLLAVAIVAACWRSPADSLPLLAALAVAPLADVATAFTTIAQSPYRYGHYTDTVSATVPLWIYSACALVLLAACAWAAALARSERTPAPGEGAGAPNPRPA